MPKTRFLVKFYRFKKHLDGNFHGYPLQLLGDTFKYSVLGGARVVVKEVSKKEETAGRFWKGLARKACREFPLVFLF